MIDSTRSRAVVDERTAGPAELMVEADGGGEREQALQDALSEAGEGPGAVALERECPLAAPEDRLDALADRRQVGAVPGLVLAPRPDDRGVHLADGLGECPAGVALVADQGERSLAAGARQELQGDVTLVAFGRGHRDRSGCPVGREDAVQTKAPEEAGVRAAVAIIGGVGKRRALDGLTAASALHRSAVHEQQ